MFFCIRARGNMLEGENEYAVANLENAIDTIMN